jgi:hypothetical protein
MKLHQHYNAFSPIFNSFGIFSPLFVMWTDHYAPLSFLFPQRWGRWGGGCVASRVVASKKGRWGSSPSWLSKAGSGGGGADGDASPISRWSRLRWRWRDHFQVEPGELWGRSIHSRRSQDWRRANSKVAHPWTGDEDMRQRRWGHAAGLASGRGLGAVSGVLWSNW